LNQREASGFLRAERTQSSYGDLHDTILLIFEEAICLFDMREGERMGYEWGRINLAFILMAVMVVACLAVVLDISVQV
jgi:hypothetical protein